MIFPRVTPLLRALSSALACVLLLSGCDEQTASSEPYIRLVFPDAAPLAHRYRNHSMTETPDGKLRVFAAQKGDVTELMIMRRRVGGGWSAPTVLDLPRRETNTSPRFFSDGSLYYSSDAPHPERVGRKDLNIWRVTLNNDVTGVPEVMPDAINTGSHEDGFAPLGENRIVFSSTALRGEGGYDLYIAEKQIGRWIVQPFPHNTIMADSHPVGIKEGRALIWYAHMPSDKVYGSVDLFISYLKDGHWSAPQNLGPDINTAGIDYGAGVSGDGETLFFSRDGVLLEADLDFVIDHIGYVAP